MVFSRLGKIVRIMKRDGACTSAWQQGIGDYISPTHTLPSAIVDVVIVGGGITGITTGLLLQQAGKKCVILEAHTLGFGTTGGTTAHLNTLLDTPYTTIEKNFGEEGAKTVAKAAKEAMDLIEKHVETYDIACTYKKLSGFLYSQSEEQTKELQKLVEASQKAGIDISYTSDLPIPLPFEKAVVFPEQGQFHPIQYIFALAQEFEKLGGLIVQNCRVTEHEKREVLDIATSLGPLQARHLIYATHTPPGVNVLHFKCAPYRTYAIGFKLNNDAYPESLAYDMQDPYNYHRTQEIEGEKYVIVGGQDHKTGHIENTKHLFDKLEAYVHQYYDVAGVYFRWSSQYFEPNDGIAYIGHLPNHPEDVFVATGFGGNGMIYSHIAAMELCSSIVNGRSKYDHLFSPSRVSWGGLSNFVKESADVAKEWIGKWFSVSKLEELAGFAPGDSKVVKYEGHSIALHKDESGNFHALNPSCTHLHCSVAWNNAEKSWDCPCHGARYSLDGEVLTGPASKDLEVYKLEEETGKVSEASRS